MNKISLMIIFCCVSIAVFGQTAYDTERKHFTIGSYGPKGNTGPYLEGVRFAISLIPSHVSYDDQSHYNSIDCSIIFFYDPVKKYKYKGTVYESQQYLCMGSFRGSRKYKAEISISGVGTKTFVAEVQGNDYVLKLPLNRIYTFKELSQVKVTSFRLIEIYPDEKDIQDISDCLNRQKAETAQKEQKEKDDQEKAKPEAEQKGQEERTAEQEENEITTDSNTWSTDEDEDNTAAGNQAQRTLSPEEYRRKLLEETARQEAEINRKAETARSAVEATGSMVTAMIDEESNYELTLDVGIPDDLSILYYNLTFGKRSQNKLYTGFDFSLGYAEYSFYEEKDGNTERMDETAYGLSFGIPVGYRIPLASGISTTEGSLLIGVNASASMYMGDVKMPMTLYVGPFVGIYIMHINFQFGYGSYYDLFGDSIANNALKGKQNGGKGAGFHMKFGFAW